MMAGRLEAALQALDAELESATKSVKTTQAALRRSAAAAKVGNLREIDRGLAALRTAGTELGRRLEAAANTWTFDAEGHLESGAFTAELLAAAEAAGLRLYEKDGRLYCYPMLLAIAPRELAVLVDRKPERRVRPGALVQLLAARQKLPQRFTLAPFLEALYAAYALLAPRQASDWTPDLFGQGPVVPLLQVHETLTLLPGAAREYPLVEFTRDIHLLDRNPDARTKSGHGFTLPASTGAKGGKGLTMVDERGGERRYVGLAMRRE
jgi:hypothetical protein